MQSKGRGRGCRVREGKMPTWPLSCTKAKGERGISPPARSPDVCLCKIIAVMNI